MIGRGVFMRIYELVTIPFLKGMNIIAGESGKNREVYHVNMMDAPDIIQYLKPNELLVTTAYHFKDKPELLTSLVQSMAKQECAGLGIKTKRFLQEIPEEVIGLANQLDFPIIELPPQLSLGQIVNQTLSIILDKRADELTNVMEIHKHFSNLVMSGEGMQKLIESLSETISCPISLFNQFLKPIYYSQSFIEFLSVVKKHQSLGFSFSMPNTTFFSFSILSSKSAYSVFPIYISEKKIGFLAIQGEIQSHDYMTALTIEQATNVLSFALLKEDALKQYTRRIRNDFFINFTNGAYSTSEEIINRAKEFSLENEKAYICVAGMLDENEIKMSYTKHKMKMDLIYEFLEEELSDFPVFTKGEMCILLYKINESVADANVYISSSLRYLQMKVASYFGYTISFGVSNMCTNFLNVNGALKEATDALQEGRLSKKTTVIQFYRTKDIMELLRTIPQDDLKNFCSYVLQNFTDTIESQTLLQTLSVYLETNFQISETAKKLFVHRNTVIYRLEKCEELLGRSLKDGETTLQIRVALRIKTLLDI